MKRTRLHGSLMLVLEIGVGPALSDPITIVSSLPPTL